MVDTRLRAKYRRTACIRRGVQEEMGHRKNKQTLKYLVDLDTVVDTVDLDCRPNKESWTMFFQAR